MRGCPLQLRGRWWHLRLVSVGAVEIWPIHRSSRRHRSYRPQPTHTRHHAFLGGCVSGIIGSSPSLLILIVMNMHVLSQESARKGERGCHDSSYNVAFVIAACRSCAQANASRAG